MITEWEVQHRGESLLLGLALEDAVLDVLSDAPTLDACAAFLKAPHRGLVTTRMGSFGPLPVRLNLHHDDTVSIFIDAPEFSPHRSQSASIWVGKDELLRILTEATSR